ncbi:MAG: hypothetical protein SFU27_03005 [Thermonemataceae bacterium]|nr:hypothetical protein [Thermonemataceae bacterium]
MKWIFIFLHFLFFSPNQQPIEDPSGFYKGIITQNEGGLARKYLMEMSLSIDKSGNVLGTTFFKLLDSDEIFVKYSFSGKMIDKQLILNETSIDEEQNKEGYIFCFKQMELKIIQKGRKYSLKGTWTSSNCPSAFGEISVEKKEVL